MIKIISNSKCLILISIIIISISCSNKNPLDSDTTALEAIGWVKQSSPVEGSRLFAVEFVDEAHGWIVGDSGIILITSNGGVRWKKQESSTNERLRDVAFINQKIGWVVGHNGTILKTIDGGKSWKSQESGTSSKLEEVTFLNSQVGWIAGRRDFVFLRTTDGGIHWTTESIPEFKILSSIDFTDEKKGTGILDWKKPVSTNDGGLSWTVVAEIPSNYIWSISFLDKTFGLLSLSTYEVFEGKVGWYHLIYESNDDGHSWTQINRRLDGNGISGKIFAKSKSSIFLVGEPWIRHSSDGGLSWTIQNTDNSANFLDAVFLNDQIGWAVSWEGIILHTTNGGVSPEK